MERWKVTGFHSFQICSLHRKMKIIDWGPGYRIGFRYSIRTEKNTEECQMLEAFLNMHSKTFEKHEDYLIGSNLFFYTYTNNEYIVDIIRLKFSHYIEK